MNNILKLIFDGEFVPNEKLKPPDPQYQKMSDTLCDILECFEKSLFVNDKEIFESIQNMTCEVNAMYNYECFAEGFRFAITFILETLYHK